MNFYMSMYYTANVRISFFIILFFFLMIRRPPRSTLFPYTNALPISLFPIWLHRADSHLGHLDLHGDRDRSEEHTSELQSRLHLVCRLLLEKKKYALILYI